MEFLAIRDDGCKNVYYYNTKGEKGRILSKFPKASNRVFLEEDIEEAKKWAGVERIATEEENLWAITKQPKVNIEEVKESIVEDTKEKDISFTNKTIEHINQNEENICVDKAIEENKNTDDKQVKHILSDFEKILEIYKKNNIRLLEITLINNEKFCFLVDDVYYFHSFLDKTFDYPISHMNEQTIKKNIVEMMEKDKEEGKKNISFNGFLSFEMFNRIPKTKFLAFGDLVYVNDVNYIFENVFDNEVSYSFDNRETLKNITFTTNNILNIKPLDTSAYSYLVREKDFANYIKKQIKAQEKAKLLAEQNK